MTDDPIDQIEPNPEDPTLEAANPEEAEATVSGPALGRLVLKRAGAETDIAFELRPPCVIGRFDPTVGPIDVDLGQIDEAVYVSRKHARITCEEGVWKVADLGSSNGTFLLRDDFERVEEAELEDGAELAFGNARFMFRQAAEAL